MRQARRSQRMPGAQGCDCGCSTKENPNQLEEYRDKLKKKLSDVEERIQGLASR